MASLGGSSSVLVTFFTQLAMLLFVSVVAGLAISGLNQPAPGNGRAGPAGPAGPVGATGSDGGATVPVYATAYRSASSYDMSLFAVVPDFFTAIFGASPTGITSIPGGIQVDITGVYRISLNACFSFNSTPPTVGPLTMGAMIYEQISPLAPTSLKFASTVITQDNSMFGGLNGPANWSLSTSILRQVSTVPTIFTASFFKWPGTSTDQVYITAQQPNATVLPNIPSIEDLNGYRTTTLEIFRIAAI